jgi:hypothetical protein
MKKKDKISEQIHTNQHHDEKKDNQYIPSNHNEEQNKV